MIWHVSKKVNFALGAFRDLATTRTACLFDRQFGRAISRKLLFGQANVSIIKEKNFQFWLFGVVPEKYIPLIRNPIVTAC